jgi:uncharacterized membrane protein YgaE (UPF0421/DUF939 family)
MKLWSWKQENLPSPMHCIRTAGAAAVSVCVARLIGMSEEYWAAIATLAVMQSTLGATLTLSIERIVASALGASLGAMESTYFGIRACDIFSRYFFIRVAQYTYLMCEAGTQTCSNEVLVRFPH